MQFARLPYLRGQRDACSIPEAPSHFVGPSPYAGVRNASSILQASRIPQLTELHKLAHQASPSGWQKSPAGIPAELLKIASLDYTWHIDLHLQPNYIDAFD